MTLEQQIRDLVQATARQLSGQMEERLLGLGTEVSQAAAADRVSVVRELRLAAEAEVAKRSQEAVAAAQGDHARRLEEAVSAARIEGSRRVEEAVAAVRSEQVQRIAEAVAAVRADVQRERDAAMGQLRSDLSREHESALEALRTGLSPQIDAALNVARAEHSRTLTEALARTKAEADQRVAQAFEDARRESASLFDRERSDLASELERVRKDADARIDAFRREQAGAERALVNVRAAERQNELALVERLTDGVRRLDAAKSLTEVLDALAETIAGEAPRVAVFVVRGTRLTGWRHSGFPPGLDPTKMEIPVDQPGLLGRALRAVRSVATSEGPSGDPSFVSPFGTLPDDNAALAIPVRIGGETVAVVYADDAVPGHVVPSPFPEAVEVLACHAARCLEVLTFARAAAQSAPPRPVRPAPAASSTSAMLAGTPPPSFASATHQASSSHPPLVATVPDVPPTPRYAAQTRSFQPTGDEDEDSARRYARLLVSEIKLYHDAAVAEGRRNRNLLDRLRPEIERAQHLYEERVPVQVRLKSDFFGQELVRTLAGGDPTLLGAR